MTAAAARLKAAVDAMKAAGQSLGVTVELYKRSNDRHQEKLETGRTVRP